MQKGSVENERNKTYQAEALEEAEDEEDEDDVAEFEELEFDAGPLAVHAEPCLPVNCSGGMSGG